jgi:hypothetical protein
MAELANGISGVTDNNGGIILKVFNSYYTLNGTSIELTGYTNDVLCVVPSGITEYSIDIYDDSECLIIDRETMSDWIKEYLISLGTTGYTGYEDSTIEQRIIYNQDKGTNEYDYYKLGTYYDYSGLTNNYDEQWAIVDSETETLWTTGQSKYYYDEVDDNGDATGRQFVVEKNINSNSDTKYNTKYIQVSISPTYHPSVNTISVSEITASGATVYIDLLSTGSSGITEIGVCYSIYSNPTTDELTSYETNNFTIGHHEILITDLIHDTTYYLMGYVKDQVGNIYYGNDEITFKTSEE